MSDDLALMAEKLKEAIRNHKTFYLGTKRLYLRGNPDRPLDTYTLTLPDGTSWMMGDAPRPAKIYEMAGYTTEITPPEESEEGTDATEEENG